MTMQPAWTPASAAPTPQSRTATPIRQVYRRSAGRASAGRITRRRFGGSGPAAGRGDRRGLFNLARMYHNGSGGLLPDRVKAMEFVRQAAGLGHPEAWNSLGVSPPPLRNDLGLRFVGGRGDDEDPVEAIQWCHDRVMRGRMALECEV